MDAVGQEPEVNGFAEVFGEFSAAAATGGPGFVEGAEDENGDVAGGGLGAEDLADGKAVEIRQHHVEQDDIGQGGSGEVEGLEAVEGDEHFATLFGKVVADQLGKLGVVINGQDFRLHTKEDGRGR